MEGPWRHSPGWLVGYPTLVGATVGTAGALLWRYAGTRYRGCVAASGSLDCVAVPAVQLVIGVPVAVAVIWILLALGEFRAWVPPTVTLGGLAAAGYAIRLTEAVYPQGPPDAWLAAVITGTAFGAVAVACLPRLHWTVRLLVAVVLVIPAFVPQLTGAAGPGRR